MTTQPDLARELLARLDSALDFDAQKGTDRQWSELLAEAMNAREFIATLQHSEPAQSVAAGDVEQMQEIADGAWGDGPLMRGLARDYLEGHLRRAREAGRPPQPWQANGFTLDEVCAGKADREQEPSQ